MTIFSVVTLDFCWLGFLIFHLSFPLPICENINLCLLIQGSYTIKVFDFAEQIDDLHIDIRTLGLNFFSSGFDGIRHVLVVQWGSFSMDQIEGLVQGLHIRHHLVCSSRQTSMALESCPASGLCPGIFELEYTRIKDPAYQIYTICTLNVIYPAMYWTAPSSDLMALLNSSSSISSETSSERARAALSVTNLKRKSKMVYKTM